MPCEKSAKVVEAELLYVQYKYELKLFTADLNASPHPHCGAVASCQLQRKLAFSSSHVQRIYLWHFRCVLQHASAKMLIISQMCSYWRCLKTVCSVNDRFPPSLCLSLFTISAFANWINDRDSPSTHCNFTPNFRGTNSTEHPKIQFLSLSSGLLFLVSLSLSLTSVFTLNLPSSFLPFASSSHSSFLQIM